MANDDLELDLTRAADDLIEYIYGCYAINYGDAHIAKMRESVRERIKEIYYYGHRLQHSVQ